MKNLLACLITALVFAIAAAGASADVQISVKSVKIVTGIDASPQSRLCADLLRDRIAARSKVSIEAASSNDLEPATPGQAIIYLGPGGDPLITRVCELSGTVVPTRTDPGPEGFVLKCSLTDGQPLIIAAGTDAAGTLYVVGELLRRMTYGAESISIECCEFRSAPAYRWRGTSANQGRTMQEMSGARAWTKEELHSVDLDHALAGSNTIYAYGEDVTWAKSYGIKVTQGVRPNQLPRREIPPEWKREGTEEGPYVCPSIPEARQALIEHYTKDFALHGETDVMRFFAGDPGGCRCDLCAPWGKTFIELCAELATIWKSIQPNCEVQIANQDVDNKGDEAIFEYLNTKPHAWLNSISYGPGSNAMSEYFRPELRTDLFTYPGHGPINRYLAYTLQALPSDVSIVHYSDITHWISAQYQVEHPDPYLERIYGRRTFHHRPKAFYKIFNHIMPFSEGDIIYSEGYHDEMHQYLWSRMLWNPNRSLEDLMMEYATYHFGAAAAPEMVQASLQLEENLESPLETNPGIRKYYNLVKSAGEKIPANLMDQDHRWRLAMQKASLDLYFQEKLLREKNLARIAESFLEARPSGLSKAIQKASEILSQPLETESMQSLRQTAEKISEESNALFGVKNEAIQRTGLDLTGFDWFRQQVKSAGLDSDENVQKQILDRALHYEDAGEGGFYDDAGADGRQPHRIEGENLWNPAQFVHLLDPANRPSASSFVHNRQGPVRFAYTGLDASSAYRLRVTLVTLKVTPELLARFEIKEDQLKRTQDILADGIILAKDLEIPSYTAQQYEFDIPRETTSDGSLEIRFDAHAGEGRFAAAVVSEIWLMKQQQ